MGQLPDLKQLIIVMHYSRKEDYHVDCRKLEGL